MKVKVEKIEHVIDPDVNALIDRLWYVAWDVLKGRSSWCRIGLPSEQYEFYVDWHCHDQVFRLLGIHGSYDDEQYKISFAGPAFEVSLLDAQINATFTSSPEFGYFKYEGSESPYLTPGPSCYRRPVEGQSAERFFERPFEKCNQSYHMTDEVKIEVLNYLDSLLSVIEQRYS